MASNHDHHTGCSHLHMDYCCVCDVAYCRDCGREWVALWKQSTWGYMYAGDPLHVYPNYTITCDGASASVGPISSTGTHAHAFSTNTTIHVTEPEK